jgi:phosphatidylinositol alpha-1,6-mannosyltransferase
LGIESDVPLFCYPGDLEFSTGAQTTAQAVPEILAKLPEAHIVFACRAKTPKAHQAQETVRQQLAKYHDRVHFAGEVADLPALLGGSTAVLFPVDDLYGKVDLPFAVLEACLLSVPVIVASGGPLTEIAEVPAVDPTDFRALAKTCLELCASESASRQVAESLRKHVREHHDPVQVGAAYEQVYECCLRD